MYLRQKRIQKSLGRAPTKILKNGVPCKLDSRGNAILDPITQPIKPKNAQEDESADPESINQPFFVIKASNGGKMIYREDSIKNLMNNSIVRYDDPAALEVSLITSCNSFI